MKQVMEHFKDKEDVAFLAVQTTFEGHSTNTFERGQAVMKKFDLTIPFGQDGDEKTRPQLMRDYQTRGTPWTIIIDPKGVIRYSTFHIERDAAVEMIDGFSE